VVSPRDGQYRPESLIQDLVEAGIHFGQRASNWNPKMEPYIYGKRNGIHIIDIKETVKGLLLAKKFLTKHRRGRQGHLLRGHEAAGEGRPRAACLGRRMHWVTERWLGGTLTNFRPSAAG
jgi:small subunit ribosomal protein S2